MAAGEGVALQPPHHRHDRDGDHRPRRRQRAPEDQRRPDRHRRCSARSTTAPAASRPWGTYIMAEENFHGYFTGELPADHREAANYKRFGVPERHLRMGPLLRPLRPLQGIRTSPTASAGSSRSTRSMPTRCRRSAPRSAALKHEGAESIVAKDGRVVFYLGDDERFDYVYKFVTAGTFNRAGPCRQHEPARRGHALRRPLRGGRHDRMAAARPRPGSADRRKRLRQPGRRRHRDAHARPTCSARPRWTGRRTFSPTRSTAASTSC